uniref:TetR/AcrR family transcriptional regulator C-terminal domain-containing protein n=1 Tax=Methylobacterium sp. NMS12 TaxID=3079766 RepID=UPI003F885203
MQGDDPGLAAGIFLGAIAGKTHRKYLTRLDLPTMTPEEIGAHVSEAANLFLYRYSPDHRR